MEFQQSFKAIWSQASTTGRVIIVIGGIIALAILIAAISKGSKY